jgi:hypothetical protein
MTAPVTKAAILYTGTALLFNSLRDTHTIADPVHRDSAFDYDAHKRCRFCAQGQFFRVLLCTTHRIGRFSAQGHQIAYASLRDCMHFHQPVQFLPTARRT